MAYMSMKVKKEVYERLQRLKFKKLLSLKEYSRLTISDVIKELLNFYEKHKEKVSNND